MGRFSPKNRHAATLMSSLIVQEQFAGQRAILPENEPGKYA
jgi:hypothetical protein